MAWAAARDCVLAIVAAVLFIAGRHRDVPTPTPDAARRRVTTTDAHPPGGQRHLTGTIHQKNPAFSFAVRLSLPGGASTAPSYPQLGCTGGSASLAKPALLTFHLAITWAEQMRGRGGPAGAATRRTMTFTLLRRRGSSPAGILTRQG